MNDLTYLHRRPIMRLAPPRQRHGFADGFEWGAGAALGAAPILLLSVFLGSLMLRAWA